MRFYVDGNCSPYLYLDSNNGRELNLKEKIFLAWLAPRGIVTAAVASFFYQIRAGWYPWGWRLQGLVFLTILMTVGIQGLSAKPLANRLELGQKII